MPTSFNAVRDGAGAAQKWAGGQVYGLDAIVWSPISSLLYRRIVAGAGTTDPSADATNWSLFGPSRVKSLATYTIVIAAGQVTGTVTITATDQTKTELNYLGCSIASASTVLGDTDARVIQTSSTVITATRANGGAQNLNVNVQVKEWW